MGLFQKKHDPISDKARALTAQIQALESQIKNLSNEAANPQPKFRSSAILRAAAGPRALQRTGRAEI